MTLLVFVGSAAGGIGVNIPAAELVLDAEPVKHKHFVAVPAAELVLDAASPVAWPPVRYTIETTVALAATVDVSIAAAATVDLDVARTVDLEDDVR